MSLEFEKPIKSIKTNHVVSLSQFIKEKLIMIKVSLSNVSRNLVEISNRPVFMAH